MKNPVNTPYGKPFSDLHPAKESYRALKLAVAALWLALAAVQPVQPALAAVLSEQFAKTNPASAQTINHEAFTALLKSHIRQDNTGLNRVDYAALKTSQPALQRYIEYLTAQKVSSLNKDEQFALWANLYNALTLDVVLAAYPVKSIRDIDISPGLFSNGPWGKKLVTIEGQSLSLDDIEHKILRPIFKDPRVHYAVNCASVGCPNLAKSAFTGAELDSQLEEAAKAYINSTRGVKLNNGQLSISKIYSWFQKDFGSGETAILNHLKKYANPPLKAKLQKASSIDGYFYDWNLND